MKESNGNEIENARLAVRLIGEDAATKVFHETTFESRHALMVEESDKGAAFHGQAIVIIDALADAWLALSILKTTYGDEIVAGMIEELNDKPLSSFELGCRVYAAAVERIAAPPALIERYVELRKAAGLSVMKIAGELGLAVNKTSSAGLRHQRNKGARGNAVIALWNACRENLYFTGFYC